MGPLNKTPVMMMVILWGILAISFICFIILVVRVLLKYLKTKDIRQEKSIIRKSLGEVLKQHRVNCKMTQEFVAENVGVSRQAVSKWETGIADPSTSNLIALAKLFDVSAEVLIKEVQ